MRPIAVESTSPATIRTRYSTNIARMSVLQLAVEWSVRGGGPAAGGRDLPAARSLVEEQRRPADQRDRRGAHIHARLRHLTPDGQAQVQDRFVTGVPLLLLEHARGLLAELGARARAIATVERRLEALDHGRGI